MKNVLLIGLSIYVVWLYMEEKKVVYKPVIISPPPVGSTSTAEAVGNASQAAHL